MQGEGRRPFDFRIYFQEKAILDREVCDAQDRATGLQVLWQNCKNDLVAARLDAASAQRQLTSEKTKLRQAKDQVTDLLAKVSDFIKSLMNNFCVNLINLRIIDECVFCFNRNHECVKQEKCYVI